MDATLELRNGFCEMTQDELRVIDAGGLLSWAAAIGGVYSAVIGVIGYLGTTSLACAATCAAIAGAPIVAGSAAIVGIITAAYGIYCLF